jgi:hypothetical protein
VSSFHDLATKILRAHPDVENGEEVPRSVVEALASVIEDRFGAPVLPNPGESIAVTFDCPRTAALFFDRIWHPPAVSPALPRDLLFYGATEAEIWPMAVMLGMKPPRGLDWRRVQAIFGEGTPIAELWARHETPAALTYCEVLARDLGLRAVPVYDSAAACEADYGVGSSDVLVAALDGLAIIKEGDLTWEQVVEFRSDLDAKAKLRRLRHWLDSTMVGKPVSFVRDELAIRLDDYDWALRKHGIKTATGVVTDFLDPKFLASVAGSYAGMALAGAEFWAAVGATGALLGRLTVSVTTRLLDLKDLRRTDSEVAFVHELRKLGARAKS